MSDEVQNAKEAAAAAATTRSTRSSDVDDGAGPATIFDKILSGEWSCDKVFEDDFVVAFRDIVPQAPIHIVIIPKYRDGLTQLSKTRSDQEGGYWGTCSMWRSQQVDHKECPNGFRVVINDGEQGAQAVYHLHIHVLGGRQMQWPPG